MILVYAAAVVAIVATLAVLAVLATSAHGARVRADRALELARAYPDQAASILADLRAEES